MLAKRGRKPRRITGAITGSKRLPSYVNDQRGNTGHRPNPDDPYANTTGKPLPMPIPLNGREKELWDQYSRLPWIGKPDSAMLLTFVRLTLKQESGKLSGALTREYRILAAQLRLEPSARARPLIPDRSPEPASEEPEYENTYGYPDEIFKKAPRLCSLGMIGRPGIFDKRDKDDYS